MAAVEGHLYGDRVWFYDARGRVRRMGVSTHPADGTIVVSLWQGDTCTGTFRLPAEDGARLVSTLAYGMVEAASGAGARADDAGPRGIGRRLVELLDRFFRGGPTAGGTPLRLLK